MYQYCGSTEALPCLRRITDWAEQNLGRGRGYAFNAGNGETEWYTLSENLYRAYLLTDDPRYRDFAAVWEYRDFWNHFAHQTSIFPPQTNLPTVTRYHAHSHVNALSGAAAAYLVSGEQHYLDTLVNAYEFIQTDLCYATGGFGPDEDWTPREALSAKLRTSHNSFETQCGSWAAFKMTRYLIRLTGDGRYGDWTERILYNGIGTTIPMAPDGSVQYFSDYNIAGGRKSNHNAWSCCTGTRPQAAADYANLVYFHGPASLHVNLYLPATVEWTCGLVPVTVAMQTSFPAEEQVEFTVHCKEPVSFALKFRMPGWLAGPAQAAVNGAPAPLVLDDRHWGALERRWHDGDRVSLTLPMRFRISRFGSDTDAPYALLRGPVVLAAESPEGNPAEWLKPQAATNLQQALIPCPGTPMTWRLKANAEVLFKPYYAYRQNEPYFLYLSPRPDDILRFSGDWHFGGNLRYCNEPGATVHMVFEGTGVRWLGNRFDDAGQAAVCIDGRPVAVVDQYGAGRNLPFEWKYEGLPAGKHEITLTVRKERNASSVNSYLNILGFERLQ